MTPKTKTEIPEGFVQVCERKPYPVGTSVMVAIPTDILKQSNWKEGKMVRIYKNSNNQMLIDFSI